MITKKQLFSKYDLLKNLNVSAKTFLISQLCDNLDGIIAKVLDCSLEII